MANLVVSNSSPIIALAELQRLELLRDLFGELAVPSTVVIETASVTPLPAWVHEVKLTQPLAPRVLIAGLGPGESEAVSLALETSPPWLILDDRPARRLASALGLSIIGTLGILLAAKRKGLLPALKQVLDDLMQTGFFVALALYRQVLSDAGE